MDVNALSPSPALLRVSVEGRPVLALWAGGRLRDLTASPDDRLHSLDRLLTLPVADIRRLLEDSAVRNLPEIEGGAPVLAPIESQEVWASGVTYRRSREARMDEATVKDVYALVYEAERPELFFKAAGWRVVPPGGDVGVRADSTWDVPEPELTVLSNAYGEVIAYTCGNDMSSRSIEGANPLYLPQAKVYDASCSLGPVAVLAWHISAEDCEIEMRIERNGEETYCESTRVSEMVRHPAELVAVLHASYTLPVGAWLMTGTGLVPPSYTAQPDDRIAISITGIGTLRNRVIRVQHSGATAQSRLSGISGTGA